MGGSDADRTRESPRITWLRVVNYRLAMSGITALSGKIAENGIAPIESVQGGVNAIISTRFY